MKGRRRRREEVYIPTIIPPFLYHFRSSTLSEECFVYYDML